MGIEDCKLEIEGLLRNLPGFKRQIFLNMEGDLKFLDLELQPVYPNVKDSCVEN